LSINAPVLSFVGSIAHAQLSKNTSELGTIVAEWAVADYRGPPCFEDVKKANPNITGPPFPAPPTATLMGIRQKVQYRVQPQRLTADAWEGEGYFKPTGQIRNIKSLMPSIPRPTHIVVRR